MVRNVRLLIINYYQTINDVLIFPSLGIVDCYCPTRLQDGQLLIVKLIKKFVKTCKYGFSSQKKENVDT